MVKTFVIAEAGVNHNGSIELAKKLIDIAVESGADAVKFQTFKADSLVTLNTPKADYQNLTTSSNETHYEMIKKLELKESDFFDILQYCTKKKIIFLSTAFDSGSVDMLNNLGMSIFKIPSGEITNLPYLRHIGTLKKEVILSTGMANMGEIERVIDILEHAGTSRDKITVLHCTTEYPTPMLDVNLNAMQSIKQSLGVKIGYSDHTSGIEVAIAAVAMGASIIEKHFTLDKNLPGPDHKASLEPSELQAMVLAIRNIEIALGDGIKRMSKNENQNKLVVRKSIVASQSIKAGEILNTQNLTTKRPGTGISPMLWDEAIGRIAIRDFAIDELIEL